MGPGCCYRVRWGFRTRPGAAERESSRSRAQRFWPDRPSHRRTSYPSYLRTVVAAPPQCPSPAAARRCSPAAREVVGQGNFELGFPRKAEPHVERPTELIAVYIKKDLGGILAARVAEQRFDFGKTLRHQQVAGSDQRPFKSAFRSLRADLELPGRWWLGVRPLRCRH